MEQFKARLRYSRREDGDRVYAEFEPENQELRDFVFHGMTLPISGTVAETIAAYEPTAAMEMFAAINKVFPNAYEV